MLNQSLRESVRRAYNFCCGYCSVHENEVGSELEIDHYRPQSADGGEEPGNLVYCCSACNRRKSDYWSDDEAQRLLHPQLDDWTRHLRQTESGRLAALTQRGAFHLQRLFLNRPPLIASRLARQQHITDTQTIAALQEEIDRLQQHKTQLEAQLSGVAEQLSQINRR